MLRLSRIRHQTWPTQCSADVRQPLGDPRLQNTLVGPGNVNQISLVRVALGCPSPGSMPEVRRSIIGLVGLTGLVWGLGGVLSKALVADGVDPFVVTAIPFSVGALIAWYRRIGLPISARLISDGIILGVVNSSLPALMFNLAYESLPAGVVALLLSIGPVITAVTAHFAFHDEPFTGRKAAGLFVCVVGVGALAFTPGLLEGSSVGGVLLALAGAAIAGTSAILSRRLAIKHGGRAIVAPQLTAAGLLPLIVGVLIGRPLIPSPGWEVWHFLAMTAIGAVASYGGFRLIMKANETGTTGEVSIVGYVVPVVGVVGGVLFLAEQPTLFTLVGGVFILGGIAMVGRASGKPARLVRAAG